MRLYVIYTREGVFLSKQDYPSWREVQDNFEGYMASEGPWTEEAMVEALTLEYADIQPSARDQVESFLRSTDEVRIVTFGDGGPRQVPSH